MTDNAPIVIGFQLSAVANGYIITVEYAGEEEGLEAHYVALDKAALASLIADFLSQMPTPEQPQKETRQ